MRGAPHVEPSRIELSHEVGAAGIETVDGAFHFFAHRTIHGWQDILHIAVWHLSGTIAGDERRVETGFLKHVFEFAKIDAVVAVGTIFVFNLHHEDVATVVDGVFSNLLAQAVDVSLTGSQKVGVVAAPNHVLVFLQPVGETAEVPFRTNVWARTEHNVEAQFLCRADELGEVGLTFEVEDARLALVDVPENVGRNAVDAHGFCTQHAVAPVFLRDARIVHFSAYQGDGLAVEPELAFFNLEVVGACCCQAQDEGKEEGKNLFHDKSNKAIRVMVLLGIIRIAVSN